MDVQAIVQQVADFVHDNQGWAMPIVFGLAFGESLAFISLLIPAWGALVAIGALISSSDINFWPIWIAASLGAAAGDWLSYWVGLKLEYTVAHDVTFYSTKAPSSPCRLGTGVTSPVPPDMRPRTFSS